VVYVDTIGGKTFNRPSEHALVDQKGLQFTPHILVVQQGTTVDFLNSDKVAHNVFWPDVGGNKKLGHNLGTWPQGEKRSFRFDTAGAVPLLCNVPEMAGYIVVAPTPYFAKTDKSGEYKIDNVPDGSYTVVAWHEGAKRIQTGDCQRRYKGGFHPEQVRVPQSLCIGNSSRTTPSMAGRNADYANRVSNGFL
jgi:plastocyanin